MWGCECKSNGQGRMQRLGRWRLRKERRRRLLLIRVYFKLCCHTMIAENCRRFEWSKCNDKNYERFPRKVSLSN